MRLGISSELVLKSVNSRFLSDDDKSKLAAMAANFDLPVAVLREIHTEEV